MNNQHQEKDLTLKWTWYLFVGGNFLVVLGTAITWILFNNEVISARAAMLPVTICNIIACIMVSLFFWIDSKELFLLKMHVDKKWFTYYFASGFIFIIMVIFSFVFMAFKENIERAGLSTKPFFLVLVIVSSFISLVGIGIYRYARFKIDLSILKRKRGEQKDEPTIEEPKKEKTKSVFDKEIKASSGLVDHADKE